MQIEILKAKNEIYQEVIDFLLSEDKENWAADFSLKQLENVEKIKELENQSKDDFQKAVEPAIRYLFKNHNPHTKIFINYDTAELLSGEQNHNLTSEVPD